jgi:hypothetical protein
MIVGFNHNISYRATIFHVQTEDSGLKNPQLVTLLYHGGIIIASKKTLYADIIKVDNLDQVVEELAKEQHKAMLKRLTAGEFDERILALNISLGGKNAKAASVCDTEPVAAPEPQPALVVAEDPPVPEPLAVELAGGLRANDVFITAEPIVDKFRKIEPEAMSLDELVYSYLTAGR